MFDLILDLSTSREGGGSDLDRCTAAFSLRSSFSQVRKTCSLAQSGSPNGQIPLARALATAKSESTEHVRARGGWRVGGSMSNGNKCWVDGLTDGGRTDRQTDTRDERGRRTPKDSLYSIHKDIWQLRREGRPEVIHAPTPTLTMMMVHFRTKTSAISSVD